VKRNRGDVFHSRKRRASSCAAVPREFFCRVGVGNPPWSLLADQRNSQKFEVRWAQADHHPKEQTFFRGVQNSLRVRVE